VLYNEYGGVDGTAWRCYAVLAFPLHRTLRQPFYFTRRTVHPFGLPDNVACNHHDGTGKQR
jgi:hypothetical protein